MMGPQSILRWVFPVVVAWVFAYVIYFLWLVVIDTVVGGRQIEFQFLLGSRRDLLVQAFSIVIDSAWIVLPVVAMVSAVTRRMASDSLIKALSALMLFVVLLALVLRGISVPLAQMSPMVAALFFAPLTAWLLLQGDRHD